MPVQIKPLTEKTFCPYGRIVTSPVGTPTSEASNYKFWSDLANFGIGGETEIGICTVYRQPTSDITGLERHQRTPEILIPIDAPFVVPLLLDGKEPCELEAFRVNVGEAVVIDPGIWHGASQPAESEECSYFVIFRRYTPQEDVETREIIPIEIAIG